MMLLQKIGIDGLERKPIVRFILKIYERGF